MSSSFIGSAVQQREVSVRSKSLFDMIPGLSADKDVNDAAQGVERLAKEITSNATMAGKQRMAMAKVKRYPLNGRIGMAIVRNAHEIGYGEYDLPTDIKDRQGNLVVKAGHWKMMIDSSNQANLVRVQDMKAPIKAGEYVVALKNFKDSYGDEIVAGQRIKIAEAYEDMCECAVLQTGRTHVCSAADIFEYCEAEADSENRQAALAMPKKFQAMIKEKTGKPNNDTLDRRLWNEFTRHAGNSLNNYKLMQGWVDRIFAEEASENRRSADQKTAPGTADQATKDYFEELFGQTDDPSYAKELTGSEKIRRMRVAIRKDYETLMSHAPSRNALMHHRNTIAKLARKYNEETGNIATIVAAQDSNDDSDLPLIFSQD